MQATYLAVSGPVRTEGRVGVGWAAERSFSPWRAVILHRAEFSRLARLAVCPADRFASGRGRRAGRGASVLRAARVLILPGRAVGVGGADDGDSSRLPPESGERDAVSDLGGTGGALSVVGARRRRLRALLAVKPRRTARSSRPRGPEVTSKNLSNHFVRALVFTSGGLGFGLGYKKIQTLLWAKCNHAKANPSVSLSSPFLSFTLSL